MVSLLVANNQFLKTRIPNQELSLRMRKAEQVKNEQKCSLRLDTRTQLTATANNRKKNSKNRLYNPIRFSHFCFLSIWRSLNFLTTRMCIEQFQMKENYGLSHLQKSLHPVLHHHYQIILIKQLLMHIEVPKSQSNTSPKSANEIYGESRLVPVL